MVKLKRKVTAPCALLWYKFQNISFFVVHAIQIYKINICCCLRVILFYSELYISTINLILFALGLLLFLKRYASRRTIWIVGKGGGGNSVECTFLKVFVEYLVFLNNKTNVSWLHAWRNYVQYFKLRSELNSKNVLKLMWIWHNIRH